MTAPAQQALDHLRKQIEAQGPDTPNRHYGRAQWGYLMDCLDTIQGALNGDEDPMESLARMPIESMDDTDLLSNLWLSADDIAGRLRSRLIELNYWWAP